MNYREMVGNVACGNDWVKPLLNKANAINVQILAKRQKYLDTREGIGIGDIVVEGDNVFRVAHHWGDSIQLTRTNHEFIGGSFYLGDSFVEFSGGLDPSIPIERFEATEERREASCWFFSENYVTGHNGYDTKAVFRVWKTSGEVIPNRCLTHR